ncbi:MAG: hypothetical protein KGZ86_03970 [Candidatus Latescibacteria bacterium]|nr:hypothetical protein [Candidatus Latescibacterota bacterium]
MKYNIYLLSIITIFVFVLNCDSPKPPVISSISGPSSVSVNGSATFTCIASDPNGDPLTYSWTCTSGSFSSSAGSSVTWYAPGAHGSSTITVEVSDGTGREDSKSKTITIQSVTTTLIDWSGSVSHGYYNYWARYIQAGYTISGYFTVLTNDINFLILNSSNYSNWVNNSSYTYIVRNLYSTGASFSATINTSDTYYFILDNTYSLFTDKTCDLFVESTSP